MALDFPTNPTTGQTYTSGLYTWTWSGKSWVGARPPDLSGIFIVYSTSTGSLTLQASDSSRYIRTTSATPVSIIVPPQTDVAWADNTEIVFEQAGAGQITIVTGSGVVINTDQTLLSDKQYSVIGLKRVGSDVWTLAGALRLP